MVRVVILGVWDMFSGLGLSGLGLDLACGAALAALCMAAIPLLGRGVGALMDCIVRGLGSMFGSGSANRIVNYLTFPGVVLHELSHAAGVKLSGAKITGMRLFEPDGETLGSVQFQCRGKKKRQIAFQRAVSSCAPVIGGIVFILIFKFMAAWAGGYMPLVLLSWHGAFSMACHMDMSRQDMKNYLKGCFWLLPYLAMAFTVIAYAIGHNA